MNYKKNLIFSSTLCLIFNTIPCTALAATESNAINTSDIVIEVSDSNINESDIMPIAMSQSYTSTYEMTGGLQCRSMKVQKNSTISVGIDPTKGSPGCDMGITIEKLSSNGSWNAYSRMKYVSSTIGGTVSFKISDSGTYRVYLRNFSNMSSGSSGTKWTGSINVSWN